MTSFVYRPIGQELIHELHRKVLSGQSAVLLGPRYGGKRYVMDRVRTLLVESGISPLMDVRLFTETPLCKPRQVAELLLKSARGATGLGADGLPTDDPFELLRLLAGRTRKPLYLFAANVDGMSHHLARRFLQEVRMLDGAGHLVAVMSGENDFRELVHGENSEFNCANRYALQGYTLEEYGDFLERYVRHLGLSFLEPEVTTRQLWKATGGNLYILRTILWAIAQQRERAGTSPGEPVKVDEIPDRFKLTGIPGAYGSHIFRHATQLIARDPESWEQLEKLIEHQRINAPLSQAPGHLELAGIAAKEFSEGGATLNFSSPMMEAFVRRYYDARRLGDLYASVGRWDEAFRRYNQLDLEERVRPSGTDDRAEVEATIGVLCSSLYERVTAETKGGEDLPQGETVRRLFAQGCCYVLGFREITFWQRDMILTSAGWKDRQLDTASPSQEVMDQIRKLLPDTSERDLKPGILVRRGPLSKYAVVAVLPAPPHKQSVVVVSDFAAGVVISQERARLIGKVLEHFIGAYRHAEEVAELQTRHRFRTILEDIIGSVFDRLGTHDYNVHALLVDAAAGLRRQLPYRRVLFCLVDKERTCILGEVDDSDDPSVDVAARTNWPLYNPTDDLQPYVVHTCQPKIIKDARDEPLANQEIVRDAGMGAEAIIPVLNRDDLAVGTIHVERNDGQVPTNEEVDDLMLFGRQLAVAIKQCEQLNLIEAALDKIPEPLLIVDKDERTRYRNEAVSEFFDQSPTSLDDLPDKITEPLLKTLANGHRDAIDVDLSIGGADKHVQFITDRIQDWRGRPVAGLLRIQDLTYLDKYSEAPLLPAEAPDAYSAMQRMIEAIERLGHRWARLYLIRKSEDGGPDLFQSAFSYGEGLSAERAEEFRRGEVVLAPRGEGAQREWLCIDEKRPVVFCWKKDIEDGKEYVTPYGITALNWRDPRQHPRITKRPGEFWMDFPLIYDGAELGKICLQFDETLRQEGFVNLRKLSQRFSSVLAGKLRQDQNLAAREQMIKLSVVEKTMATMAHNLGTRLGSLYVILDRYQLMEEKCKGLAPINAELDDIIKYTETTVKRANELLSPVSPRFERVDICEAILRTLRVNLAPETWELICEQPLPEMLLDVHLFDTALLELIRNSRDAAASPDALRITIRVEPSSSLAVEGVIITYRDNGPGVPVEYQEHIFDDFFSYRPKRKAGTGLGMGFVRRVMMAHGNGSIYYSNDFLKSGHDGAEFTISLPRLKEAGRMEEETSVQSPDS